MKLVEAVMHRKVRVLSYKNGQSFDGTVDGNGMAHRMITRYLAARNYTEYPRGITEWQLIVGVEERGVAGVEADGNRPRFKVDGDATPFDREIGHFVETIRLQSLSGQ